MATRWLWNPRHAVTQTICGGLMIYPDYQTIYGNVSGDTWSHSEARKKVKAPFPQVYITHHITGIQIAWNPEAYKNDTNKKEWIENTVAAFYAKGLFVDSKNQSISATSVVIRLEEIDY